VRISNNGEFIHANPDSSNAQGNSNVTHGCVNLSLADAEEYFHSAIWGDPVEVTGTSVNLGPDDGDIYIWAMSWEKMESEIGRMNNRYVVWAERIPSTPDQGWTNVPTVSPPALRYSPRIGQAGNSCAGFDRGNGRTLSV